MRELKLTALSAAALGALTTLITWLTWPRFDGPAAYQKASTAASYAGADAPNPIDFILPPAGFYTGHTIAGIAGAVILLFGLLLIALWLHARAVTDHEVEPAVGA